MSNIENESAESMLIRLIGLVEETGADLMVGSFNGGHDEGGIEEIALYRRREGDDSIEQENLTEVEYEPTSYRWGDPLYDLANDLLSSKYGGWAWDGSAWGEFTVDCRLRKAWEAGSETKDVEIEEPLVVQL